MPADLTWKQGDTALAAIDNLTLTNGTVPNFAGATVAFQMRTFGSSAPLTLGGTSSFTNTATGSVQFLPVAADVATPGNYSANWLVTFASGQVMTWPTAGYIWVAIEPSLTSEPQLLVDLSDVKEHLNIQPGSRVTDGRLIRLIQSVRPLIENITGPILLQTYEEWHDGGQHFIRVRRRPSTGFGTSPVFNLIACSEYRGPIEYALAIVQDPTYGSIYSCMADTRGNVYRRSPGGGVIAFPAMPRSVHVWYQAGQQSVPANVYEATLELLRVNYETTMNVGRGSRTRADEFDSEPSLGFYMPRRVREMLSPNRRAPSVA